MFACEVDVNWCVFGIGLDLVAHYKVEDGRVANGFLFHLGPAWLFLGVTYAG